MILNVLMSHISDKFFISRVCSFNSAKFIPYLFVEYRFVALSQVLNRYCPNLLT